MQLSKLKKVAIGVAFKAGRYIAGSVGNVRRMRYKGETNIVTEIDKKSEEIIVGAIKKSYPDHNFLAEEKKYTLKKSDFTWIIDPIDGTTNFVHGFPFFCVSIALQHRGKTLLGVVYDPMKEELFYAERGKGAFLNKKRIRVSKIRDLKKALLATGFAYNVNDVKDNNIRNFSDFIKAAQAIRRAGSAALDLCYVASGRFDGFWELYLNPWDIAAGALILEEAGGRATNFDGSKYTLYDKKILATNSKIHSQMLRILANQ